jgi:NitT/TauT family transport system ATP-binding protein
VPPSIALRGVSKVYRPPKKPPYLAIDRVDLDVDQGRFVSVVGPSGCGKSTILALVAGLIPATAGTITIRGDPVNAVRTDVGFLFQRDALLPWRTVSENVSLALRFRGLGRREITGRVDAWLARVGLAPFADNFPHELSGGMRKRAQLAQSLVVDPTVLLMDEPFSALDEPTRLEMQELVVSLWHRTQPTIFCITHSITEAVYLGERIWVMTHAPGQVAYDIRENIPPTVGIPPLVAQERTDFKNAVRVVTEVFRKVSDMHAAPRAAGS